MSHHIDIEAEWEEFTRQHALVEPKDADDFLAVLYAWRDEQVSEPNRVIAEIKARWDQRIAQGFPFLSSPADAKWLRKLIGED
jgi:hypothetical protein